MHPLPLDGFELMNFEEVKKVIFKDLNTALNLSIEQFAAKNYIETENVHKLLNHPVHIIDKEGNLSPSALIPFCEFAGNMSTMGVEIEHFDVSVCNSFQAKVLNDQLCYEVDLNRFTNRDNKENELKLGFAFIMDYNEDRQVTFDQDFKEEDEDGLVNRIAKSDDDKHASIFLDTIGKLNWL